MPDTYEIGLGNDDADTRKRAGSDYVSFWDGQAKRLAWFSPWKETLDWQPPFARWFVGGTINASYNALDVHQDARSNKPAILWEGENGDSRVLTYSEMLSRVKRFANVPKVARRKKGGTASPCTSRWFRSFRLQCLHAPESGRRTLSSFRDSAPHRYGTGLPTLDQRSW